MILLDRYGFLKDSWEHFFGWRLLHIGGWRRVFVVALPLQMRKCTNIFSRLIVVSPELHIMPVTQLFFIDAPAVLVDAPADVGGVGTPPPPYCQESIKALAEISAHLQGTVLPVPPDGSRGSCCIGGCWGLLGVQEGMSGGFSLRPNYAR